MFDNYQWDQCKNKTYSINEEGLKYISDHKRLEDEIVPCLILKISFKYSTRMYIPGLNLNVYRLVEGIIIHK